MKPSPRSRWMLSLPVQGRGGIQASDSCAWRDAPPHPGVSHSSFLGRYLSAECHCVITIYSWEDFISKVFYIFPLKRKEAWPTSRHVTSEYCHAIVGLFISNPALNFSLPLSNSHMSDYAEYLVRCAFYSIKYSVSSKLVCCSVCSGAIHCIVENSHMWLLTSWNVPSISQKFNLYFDFGNFKCK